MARAIRITAGSVSAEARLNDSKTAGAIWDALPIEAKGQTWGDEIYFDISLSAGPESPREVVERGDLAYWPPGHAFCMAWQELYVSVLVVYEVHNLLAGVDMTEWIAGAWMPEKMD